MKVRLLKSTAGAGGNIRSGTVLDVSETEARLLIETKYAERVEPANPATSKKEQPKKKDKKES